MASEKVDLFRLVSLAWIHSFQRREELVHRKVDNDEIEFFPDRRFPVQVKFEIWESFGRNAEFRPEV